MTTAATFRSVAALLAGVAFLLTGNGLLLTIVPLRAAAELFSEFQIGLLGSAYYIGFVAGCIAAPYAIIRAGHIRAFTAMIAVAAAAALVLSLFVSLAPWLLARAISGACIAGLFLVVESWLNDRVSNHNRGLIFSSYIIVNFSAITVGQLLATTHTAADFPLFSIAAMMVALATVPVALTRSAQPAPVTRVRFRPVELYKRAPVAIVGITVIGLTNGAFWSLAILYATGKGLAPETAPIFMSIAVVGGALIQWPLGRLSDRLDRRLILLGLLAAAAVVGLIMAFVPLGPTALFVGAALLGSTLLPGYAIAAAHAFDRADRKAYVETSASILLANGLGSVVGPIIASLTMGAIGPGGLFLFTAVAQILLCGFIVLRLRQRPSAAGDEKTVFDLAATSPVSAVVTPEPLDLDDPDVIVPDVAGPEGGGTAANLTPRTATPALQPDPVPAGPPAPPPSVPAASPVAATPVPPSRSPADPAAPTAPAASSDAEVEEVPDADRRTAPWEARTRGALAGSPDPDATP